MLAWLQTVKQIFRNFQKVYSFIELQEDSTYWGGSQQCNADFASGCKADKSSLKSNYRESCSCKNCHISMSVQWEVRETPTCCTHTTVPNTFPQCTPMSQQCSYKGLWSTVPVSQQTEKKCVHSCTFHSWAMARLHLHEAATLRGRHTTYRSLNIKQQS